MPNQTIALAFAPPAEALHEAEYQALVTALSDTARGRAFLNEHARRARAADTAVLLAALDRIESLVRAQSGPQAAVPAHAELQALLHDLRAARPSVEASPLSTQRAQLSALLDLMEQRLADVLDETGEDARPEIAAATVRALPRVHWTETPPEAAATDSDAEAATYDAADDAPETADDVTAAVDLAPEPMTPEPADAVAEEPAAFDDGHDQAHEPLADYSAEVAETPEMTTGAVAITEALEPMADEPAMPGEADATFDEPAAFAETSFDEPVVLSAVTEASADTADADDLAADAVDDDLFEAAFDADSAATTINEDVAAPSLAFAGSTDALAAIMALSENERIALFT